MQRQLWNRNMINHFSSIQNPRYDQYEISDLYKKYSNSLHKDADVIAKLLNAVLEWNSFINPSPFFKEKQINQNLKNVCDNIAEVFNQTTLAEISPDAKKTTEDAVNYCANFVDKNIKDLEKYDPKLYLAYQSEPNKLKEKLGEMKKGNYKK